MWTFVEFSQKLLESMCTCKPTSVEITLDYACVMNNHFKKCFERQSNTTTQQKGKATQHNSPETNFSKKNRLPRLRLKPATVSSVGDALTNWAHVTANNAQPRNHMKCTRSQLNHRGSSAGWVKSHVQSNSNLRQSISWSGELKFSTKRRAG